MFKDLSPAFHKYHVGHFLKNIQKVFLVVFIGIPFIQNCEPFHQQFIEALNVSDEKEESLEAPESETENGEESGDVEDVRRSSITTFFSLTSNELYNEAGTEGYYNEVMEGKSPSLSRHIDDNRSV